MGHASGMKATRAELRDAFGVDVARLFDSHADSIADLLKAVQHEIHMRVQHVQMVKADLDGALARISMLEDRLAKWDAPQ